uniref:Odorant receptor n=1 Tax=Bracon brevicornis TaxID=1563983 RepID=A0A6V7LR73_9HYME
MVEDWARAHNRKTHDVMMKFAYKGRAVCIFQVLITSFLIIRNILRKLPGTVQLVGTNDTTARIVPYGPSCWVPTNMSDGYYKAYYTWICLHWLAAGLTYIFIDIYIFGLGMHMCGQFELLYHDLSKISANESYDDQQKKLASFVQRHNHLLNVAETIEEVFNLPILMEVINNTLIISISGLILI